MKHLYRLVCALSGIILCAGAVHAQKVGTTSMQFLKVMPCARATALGEAYSVWATGAEAVHWNPSGVALVTGHDFSTTYTDWIFDTRQGAFSYATSLGDIGALGAQIQYVDYGTIEETSPLAIYMQNAEYPGMTGRTFRPYSFLVGLTYARSLTDRFAMGIGVKYAHESLYGGQRVRAMVSQGVYEEVKTWGSGVLFDFGVRYNTGFKSIQIAAAVQNFGPEIEYAKETNLVPLLFRLGAAANIMGQEAIFLPDSEDRLSIAFDIFQPNDYDQQAHMGIEYEFASTFALRAGYKLNYDYEGLTVGGGVKHTIGSINFSVDYSYGSIGTYLGAGQRISIGAEIP